MARSLRLVLVVLVALAFGDDVVLSADVEAVGPALADVVSPVILEEEADVDPL